MDVVKLQPKRLYAAYDSPLVANQTDSNAFDVPGEEKDNYVGFKKKSTRQKLCLDRNIDLLKSNTAEES